MKIFLTILEAIFSPFSLLIRSDNFINHNKPIKTLWILLISLVVVIIAVLIVYRKQIF